MNNVHTLLTRFIEATSGVQLSDEDRAEVVINLAKQWDIDDGPLRQTLRTQISENAANHPYFYWIPAARFKVGGRIRVIDGAIHLLGKSGHIKALSDPRRFGVLGMARPLAYSVVLDGQSQTWGFREDQLESAK